MTGIAARTAGLAVTTATQLWLARSLGPTGYGSFVLALVVNGAAVHLANIGLGSSVGFWTARSPTRARPVLIAGLLGGLGSAGVAVILLLLLLVVGRFDPFPDVDPAWLVVAVAAIPFRVLQEAVAGVTVGLGRAGRSLALTAASPVIFLAALLAARAGGPIDQAVVASAWWMSQAGSLAVAVGLALPVLKSGSWDLRSALRSTVPVFVVGAQQTLNAAAWWFLVRTDRSIVGMMAGAAAAGRFSVAASIADVLLSIPAVVTVATFAGFSRGRTDLVARRLQGMMRGSVALVGTGLVIGVPLVGLLSGWLLGPAYSDVALVLLALAPGILSMSLVTLITPYFFASLGRPALNLVWTGAALAVLVPAVWSFTAMWGVVGTGIGTSVAYLTAGAVSLRLFAARSDTSWRHSVMPTARDGRAFLNILAGIDPFAE